MANTNDALGMGGVVILVTLIAFEFMGAPGDDEAAVESADAAATSPAPVQQLQDAGQAAMDTIEQTTDSATESVSDLIIDMGDAASDMADSVVQETNEAVEDIADAMPTLDMQAAETEMAQTADAVETAAIEQTMQIEENAAAVQNEAAAAIEQHLAAAEESFNALRMMTPPGNNAYEHYQAVLAIDPNNAAANAGIQKMVDKYVGLAQNAVAGGNLSKARVFVDRAETLSPGTPKLANLRNMLN